MFAATDSDVANAPACAPVRLDLVAEESGNATERAANVEALCRAHVAFADEIARSINRSLRAPLPVDTLIAAARIGLWQAAARFDCSRGIRFEVWARPHVTGAVIDELRTETLVERRGSPRVRAAHRGQSYPWRDEPTAEEATWFTTWATIHGVRAYAGAARVSNSVDADALLPDEVLERAAALEEVRRAVADIEPVSRALFEAVYFRGEQLADACAPYGVCTSWGSRLVGRAVVKIQEHLRRRGYR